MYSSMLSTPSWLASASANALRTASLDGCCAPTPAPNRTTPAAAASTVANVLLRRLLMHPPLPLTLKDSSPATEGRGSWVLQRTPDDAHRRVVGVALDGESELLR